VTVSGGQVTSVRRTVRVAAALVAGQALLCGVIGFVTFDDEAETEPAARAAPPLADPQIGVPRPGGPRPAPSSAPGIDAPSGSAAAVRRWSREAASRAVPRPAPSAVLPASPAPPPGPPASPGAVPVPPAPPAQVTSPPAGLLPSAPAAEDDLHAPVEVGERCDEAGALGWTARGRIVRCARGHDGDLRWRPV
jgi:hypothetical protein